MPSATMASLASSGRKKESSLWARLSPMLVSPLKRTRMLRMGNEELTGRSSGRVSSYHIAPQKPKLRPDPQGERAARPRLLHVGVAVDDVLERLGGLEHDVARRLIDDLVAAHGLAGHDAGKLGDEADGVGVDAEQRERARILVDTIERLEAETDLLDDGRRHRDEVFAG